MERFSFKVRVLFFSCCLLVITAITGAVGYGALTWVQSDYSILTNEALPKKELVNRMYEHFLEIRMNLRSLGLPGATDKDKEYALKSLAEAKSHLLKNIEDYKKLGITDEQKPLFEEQQKKLQDFVEVGDLVLKHNGSGTEEGILEMTKIFFNQCPKTADAFTEANNRLLEYHTERGESATAAAVSLVNKSKFLFFVILISGIVFGILFALFFSNSLSKMLLNISNRLSETASKTALTSEDLSAASNQLSNMSNSSASSMEEIVASLEELSSMVKLNTESAQQANSLSQISTESAVNGDREISSLIGSMNEIVDSANKIEDIINVIDDIAFQTNLLALNAAVEAARAGEQGRGFAVVAEAVRSLAQRSASAAKEISTLIKDSTGKSHQGMAVAQASGKALQQIVDSVKKVAALNSEIAQASREQSNGIEQIAKAMNHLDQATQTNAATAEEVSGNSENMKNQGKELEEMVSELQSLVNGRRKLS